MNCIRIAIICMLFLVIFSCAPAHKRKYAQQPRQSNPPRYIPSASQEAVNKEVPPEPKIPERQLKQAVKKKTSAKSPARPLTVKELTAKINSLAKLKKRIEKKKRETVRTREEYYDDIGRYKKEILEEKRLSRGINSYAEAIRSKRINSNLSLIQRQLAYVEKLTELEYRLNMGSEELLYLEREARADLEIVKVLQTKDQLISRIDRALHDYHPNSERFALSKGKLNLKSTESIWNDIVSKKL